MSITTTASKRRGTFFSVFLLGASFFSNAHAVVFFSQNPVVGGVGAFSDFTPTSIGTTQQIADNYQSGVDTAVTSVRWWGTYGGNNVMPDDFTLRFFLNTPSDVPFPCPIFSVTPETVTRVQTGIQDGFSFDVYEYSAPLPAPFAINGNTRHHLSIVNQTSNGEWVWHASDSNDSFFRIEDGNQWQQSSTPNFAFRLSEKAVIGPVFELFVKEFIDANPPGPPPVEVDLFHRGVNPGGPTGLLTVTMQNAVDGGAARIPFDVRLADFSNLGDVAAVEFFPLTPGNPTDETFFDLLIDLSLNDGSEQDLVHLRDFNVTDPGFFSAWFDVTGIFGTTTYHTLFQSQTAEFFNVDIGEPGSPMFPVSFGLRGDPNFTVTITASNAAVPEPQTGLLLLSGLLAFRKKSRDAR